MAGVWGNGEQLILQLDEGSLKLIETETGETVVVEEKGKRGVARQCCCPYARNARLTRGRCAFNQCKCRRCCCNALPAAIRAALAGAHCRVLLVVWGVLLRVGLRCCTPPARAPPPAKRAARARIAGDL